MLAVWFNRKTSQAEAADGEKKKLSFWRDKFKTAEATSVSVNLYNKHWELGDQCSPVPAKNGNLTDPHSTCQHFQTDFRCDEKEKWFEDVKQFIIAMFKSVVGFFTPSSSLLLRLQCKKHLKEI